MTPIFRQPRGLTAKIPMEQKVISNNEVYEYTIKNNKVYYLFLYFIIPERLHL